MLFLYRFLLLPTVVAGLISALPAQTTPLNRMVQVPLVVPEGTPLRLEIEKTTFPKHVGDLVRARLAEPVFAFDREVVPAGSEVVGHVTRFSRDAKGLRVKKVLSGNFGSFRHAQIEFDTVLRRDGKPLRISASTQSGGTQVVEMRASSASAGRHGIHGLVDRSKQEARTKIRDGREFLHSPKKVEMIRDAALAHSPYQPLAIADRSRFDVVLKKAESFGAESVPATEISQLGQVAPQSGELRADLLTELNSASTHANSPVDAVVMSPLFSSDHQLLIPVGTHLVGRTTVSRPAKRMHKNGQLRFAFQKVILPADVQALQQQLALEDARLQPSEPERKIEAHLGGIVISRSSHVGVNAEGETQVKESKTRFMAPALSLALATAATQQEHEDGRLEDHNNAQVGAGAMVFGLAGAVVGPLWRPGAIAFGFAGAGRSVYKQFFGKGLDIEIPKHTSLLIDFDRSGKTLPQAAATASSQ